MLRFQEVPLCPGAAVASEVPSTGAETADIHSLQCWRPEFKAKVVLPLKAPGRVSPGLGQHVLEKL